MWFLLLLIWFSVTSGRVQESDEWYDGPTTQRADTDPPDMEYQEILFRTTELVLSSKHQLQLIMDAYDSANWTKAHARNLKVIPNKFNETVKILDQMNRTVERKINLGYHFLQNDLSDPIDRMLGDKLIECFREMKKYVDRLETDSVMEDKNIRKATVEMRMQINTAIDDLQDEIPHILESMRLFRHRVTRGPY